MMNDEPPIARVLNEDEALVDDHRSTSQPGYLSAKDVSGCWCTMPMMGLHCYGLQALDDDTLIESPPECLFGIPFPPFISSWFCASCHPKRFSRQGHSNIFKSHGEGVVIKFNSENNLTSNNCGNGGCPCGHPRSMRLCCMPDCLHTVLGTICCVCA